MFTILVILRLKIGIATKYQIYYRIIVNKQEIQWLYITYLQLKNGYM